MRGKLKLTVANETIINTYGQRVMDLNLGLRRAFAWAFVIADVECAILGADFLAHFGLTVDLKSRRIADTKTTCCIVGIAHIAAVHGVAVASSQPPGSEALSIDFKTLLKDFNDLFEPNASPGVGPTAAVQHHLVTTGPPVFASFRRLSGEKYEAAKQHFDLLLLQGTIRPSSSQWASPLHLIKRGKSWRVSGDYRRLNSITVPDRYPIPRIEDLLLSLHGCRVFSKLDLKRAYFQISVAPEDVEKTAVTTPFGLFEFVGMPLGLRNATQTFQRHMDALFRHLPFVRVYLDDLLIASADTNEHLQHLRSVFEILRSSKLTLNSAKCLLAKEDVVFLGYHINSEGFKPPEDRVTAILE